jgi:hypothetical protein
MPDPTTQAEAAPPPAPEPVPSTDLERVDPEHPIAVPGVQPSRNYLKAIEIGHVLAASELYPDSRDPAKAAVKVMIAMDLGLSPVAGLTGIHFFEDKKGKVNIIVEGKLLAAMIKMRDGYDFKFTPVDRDDESKGVIRGPERVSIDFYRGDQRLEPSMDWTMEKAKNAGVTGSPMYQKYPTEMLTWRALAEGARIHFPELLAGNPIYTEGEFGEEGDATIQNALTPPKAQPLTDAAAETLRAEARSTYDELCELNPDRLVSGRFGQMVKNAEHSHEQLKTVVQALTDLRDSEREIITAREALSEALGADKAKPIIEAAERRASQQERLEALQVAMPTEGEPDGEPG